ncbi:MAG: DUF2971 domain-containing protein [Nitrososphaeraceae archaeon]
MSYDIRTYKKRMRSRTDLSSYLTHLTRGNDDNNARNILLKILKNREIKGSNNNGFICGKNNAVCFQDAPIHSLCQNSYHEQIYTPELGGKRRYSPIGLCFKKAYVYNKGGRPVIYERTDIAKKFIKEEEWWRIVSFDLSNEDSMIDWTHEREWRCKGDFCFELADVIVLLTNHKTYKKFIEIADEDIVKNIGGIIVLDPILT